MLLILGIVLLVLWITGFAVFHVASWAIHLLIVFAILSFIFHFVTGRRSV